jgi:quercetin dioxygenase-like cupin family protein
MNTAPDPKIVAANVYKVINENEKMRVVRVTFKLGETAKMHHHPDHMLYVMKGGKLNLTSEGKTQTIDLKEGSAMFMEAQDHEATNIGNSIVDLLVVELKST